MQSLHAVYCVIFNTFYNKYWNCYLFCLFSLVLKKSCSNVEFVHVLKQQFTRCSFIELINGRSQTNRDQNRTYYFYNDMTNLKNFESSLLKIDKKHYRKINTYYTGCVAIKRNDGYESIDSVNPLYWQVNHASGYIEEKSGNRYLIFDDSVNGNKELLKKYADV